MAAAKVEVVRKSAPRMGVGFEYSRKRKSSDASHFAMSVFASIAGRRAREEHIDRPATEVDDWRSLQGGERSLRVGMRTSADTSTMRLVRLVVRDGGTRTPTPHTGSRFSYHLDFRRRHFMAFVVWTIPSP